MRRLARRGSSMLTAARDPARVTRRASISRASFSDDVFALVMGAASTPSEELVWIKDRDDAFSVGKLVKKNEPPTPGGGPGLIGAARARTCDVILNGGRYATVPESDLGPAIQNPSALHVNYEDMVKMEEVNEATILHNLKLRFRVGDIYTKVGPILVSINPFQWEIGEEFFNEDWVRTFRDAQDADEVKAPHLFAIPSAAYRRLQSELRSQAIIISGESGAGKTEAAKKCLQFLSSVAGSALSSGVDIGKRVLAANPLLEAFGNAKTVRNDNSSRFGKWMEAQFNHKGQLAGARIVSYLLEKTRVTHVCPNERSFHVFYQICAGIDDGLRAEFGLGFAAGYEYLSSSQCIELPAVNDAQEFADTVKAMEDMGLSDEDMLNVWKVVACVLHLGNITFTKTEISGVDGSTVDDAASRNLGMAATLLGVSTDQLARDLTTQTFSSRTDMPATSVSVQKACASRDALAKALYHTLFQWLVARINDALLARSTVHSILSSSTIGMLDIFGFEIFDNNGFEQLCINYCNEKLQNYFNLCIFKREEECYREQGIDVEKIAFKDNGVILDLIENRKTGIMNLLEDAVIQVVTDEKFYSNLEKTHSGKSTSYIQSRALAAVYKSKDKKCFGIKHYAGDVVYDVVEFVDKNRDEMPPNLDALVRVSNVPFVRDVLFASTGTAIAASKGKSRSSTQSAKFRGQLDALMDCLQRSDPHFVRCIKPNDKKTALLFVAPMCLAQLRYAGVFEAVRILQEGYPFRWTYQEFCKRYHMLKDPEADFAPWHPRFVSQRGQKASAVSIPAGAQVFRSLSSHIVTRLATTGALSEAAKADVKFGVSMVLYRAEANRVLEHHRMAAFKASAVKINSTIRAFIVRKFVKSILYRFRFKVYEAVRRCDVSSLGQLMVELDAIAATYPVILRTACARVAARASSEFMQDQKVAADARAVLAMDVVLHEAEYRRVVTTAEHRELGSRSQFVFPKDIVLPLDPNSALMIDCRHLLDRLRLVLDSLRQRRDAIRQIESGMVDFDRAAIESGLSIGDSMVPDWGDVLGESLRSRAAAVLHEIHREQECLSTLETALVATAMSHECAVAFAGSVAAGRSEPTFHGLSANIVPTQVQDVLSSITQSKLQVRSVLGRVLMACGDDFIKLRQALLGMDYPRFKATIARLSDLPEKAKLPLTLQREMDDAVSVVMNVDASRTLQSAITSATYGEDIQVADVDVATIAQALSEAQTVPNPVLHLQQLLWVGSAIRDVRQAFVKGDFVKLTRVLAESCSNVTLTPLLEQYCAKEMHAFMTDLESRRSAQDIMNALAKGGATGHPGQLVVTAIDVTQLDSAALKSITTNTSKGHSSRMRRLKALLGVIRPLRVAQRARDWPEVDAVVDTLRSSLSEFGDAVLVCKPEVDLAIADVDNRRLVERLVSGFQQGRVVQAEVFGAAAVGKRSPIHVAGVSVQALRDAVDSATSVSPCLAENMPDQTSRLLETATALISMRDAVVAGDWDAADGVALTLLSQQHAVPSSVEEARLVQSEAEYRRVVNGLRHGIDNGKISDGPQDLPLSLAQVECDALAVAVDKAKGTTLALDDAAKMLLQSGEHLLALRRMVTDGRWADVPHLVSQLTIVPPAVHAEISGEVAAANGLYQDWFVSDAILSALSSGGPRLLPDGIDTQPLTIKELQAALVQAEARLSDLASRGLCSGGRLATLTTVARVMVSARSCGKHGDWISAGEHVGALRKMRLQSTHPDVYALISSEVDILASESDLRAVSVALNGALANDQYRGDASTVSVTRLNSALELANTTPLANQPRFKPVFELMWTAQHMRDLRAAVIINDWSTAAAVVDAINAATANRRNGTGTFGGDAHVPVGLPAVAAHEFAAISDETDTLTAVNAVTDAVRSGSLTGVVGHVDVTALSDAELSSVIQVWEPHCRRTPLLARAMNIAKSVRDLRRKMLGDDWEGVTSQLDRDADVFSGGGLSFVFKSLASSALEPAPDSTPSQRQFRVLERLVAEQLKFIGDEAKHRKLCECLRVGIMTGGPIPCATPLVCTLVTTAIRTTDLNRGLSLAQKWPHIAVASPTVKRLHATAQIVRRFRDALRIDDWTAAARLFESESDVLADIAPEAEAEVAMISDELASRDALKELCVRLSVGGPQFDADGVMDLNKIETSSLQAIVSKCVGLRPAQAPTSQLFTAVSWAKAILTLRTAMLTEDKSGLETLFATYGADGSGLIGSNPSGPLTAVANLVQSEFKTVRTELDNIRMVAMIKSALASGKVAEIGGEPDISCVRLEDLEAALAIGRMHGAHLHAPTVALYHGTASFVLCLRRMVLRGDWDAVANTLVSPPVTGIADDAKEELALIAQQAHGRIVLQELRAALRSGGPSGDIGDLRTMSVDVYRLDAAIAGANDALQADPALPTEVSELVAACRYLRSVRSNIQSGLWPVVEKLVDDVRVWSSSDATTSVASYNVHPLIQAEIARVDMELVARNVDSRLRSALEQGLPSGHVGQLSFATVSVSQLETAIAYASNATRMTPISARLLATARRILAIRTLLLSRSGIDWPAVRAQVAIAYDEFSRGEFDQFGWPEVEVLMEEMHTTTLCADMKAALVDGCATGQVGAIDLSACNTRLLQPALESAQSGGCYTVAAKRLVLSGLLLRKLRLLALASDWHAVRDLNDDCGSITDDFQPQLDVHRLLSSQKWSHRATASISDCARPVPITELPIIPECRNEVTLLLDAANDEIVCTALVAAMRHDGVTGTADAFDTSQVSVSRLNHGLGVAATIGCASDRSRLLLSSSQLLKKLRQCVLEADWSKLATLLEDASHHAIAVEMSDEILLLRYVAGDAAVFRQITEGIKRACGAVMSSFASAVFTVEDGDKSASSPEKKRVSSGVLPPVVSPPRPMPPRPPTATAPAPRPAVIVFKPGPKQPVTKSPDTQSRSVHDDAPPVAVGVSGLHLSHVGEKCRSARTVGLLGVVDALQLLHAALTSGDWQGVDAAVGRLQDLPSSLPSDCLADVETARDTAANKLATIALRGAFGRDCVSGRVGALSVAAVSNARLLSAISRAKRVSPPSSTPDLSNLLLAAVDLVSLRQAVIADNWEDVAQIVSKSTLQTPPPECDSEVSLIRRELADRTARALLCDGLCRRSFPDGVDPLALAVTEASRLQETSDATLKLLTVAKVVQPLRRGSAADDWSSCAECLHAHPDILTHLSLLQAGTHDALSSVVAEVSGYVSHIRVRDACQQLCDALEAGGAMVDDDFQATSETVRLTQGLARLGPGSGDSLVVEADDSCEELYISVQTSTVNVRDVDQALFDAAAVLDEKPHNVLDAVRAIGTGISQLRATLVAGDWDAADECCLSVFDTLDRVAGVSVASDGIRDSVVDSAISRATHSARGEIRRVMRGLVTTRLLQQLKLALLHDRCVDGDGNVDGTHVQLGRLDAGIRVTLAAVSKYDWVWFAGESSRERAGVPMPAATPESLTALLATIAVFPPALQSYVVTAVVVRDVRLGVLTGDWDTVGVCLSASDRVATRVPACAVRELDAARRTYRHRAIVNGPLRAALLHGGPRGLIGVSDPLNTVETSSLSAAIDHANSIGTSSVESATMVTTAVFVRDMRTAFQCHDWASLFRLVCDIREDAILPLAVEEYQRYRAEVYARVVRKDLISALSDSTQGGVKWRPVDTTTGCIDPATVIKDGLEAYIDTKSITCDALDTAIAQAEQFGAGGDDAGLLLTTARILRSLRASLLHDDLPAMFLAIEKARDAQLAAMVHTELSAILSELDERAIVSELTIALKAGCIKLPQDCPESNYTAGISVAELDAALDFAEQMKPKTAVCKALVSTAIHIRGIRQSLLDGDWQNVKPLVDAATIEGVTEIARSEVYAALCVWRAREAELVLLDKLLCGCSGVLSGGTASRVVANTNLQTALAAVDGLPSVSSSLLGLQAVCRSMLHLREALLAEDWPLVDSLTRDLQASAVPMSMEVAKCLAAEIRGIKAAHHQHVAFGTALTALRAATAPPLRSVDAVRDAIDAAKSCVHEFDTAVKVGEHGRRATDSMPVMPGIARLSQVVCDAIEDASLLLDAVLEINMDLSTARELLQPRLLREAIQRAEDMKIDTPELSAARATHATLLRLTADATAAMENYDVDELKQILTQAESMGVVLENDSAIRRIIAMPVRIRLDLQLKRALASKNVERVAAVTASIKGLFFEECGLNFEFGKFPGLRSSASLQYDAEPLSDPLTYLPEDLVPACFDVSVAVLGYCGDSPSADPSSLVEMLLNLALSNEPLRDELFCQLVRQLNGNDRPHSVDRLWQLMLLALSTFPPSEPLENYLEHFLRLHDKMPCVLALHRSAYGGARGSVPSAAEIESLLGFEAGTVRALASPVAPPVAVSSAVVSPAPNTMSPSALEFAARLALRRHGGSGV